MYVDLYYINASAIDVGMIALVGACIVVVLQGLLIVVEMPVQTPTQCAIHTHPLKCVASLEISS